MQASAYTKKIGGVIYKVKEERFGHVNSYHVDVLDHVFKEL